MAVIPEAIDDGYIVGTRVRRGDQFSVYFALTDPLHVHQFASLHVEDGFFCKVLSCHHQHTDDVAFAGGGCDPSKEGPRSTDVVKGTTEFWIAGVLCAGVCVFTGRRGGFLAPQVRVAGLFAIA